MNSPRLRCLAVILGAATSSCAAAPQPPALAMAPAVGDHSGPPPPSGFFDSGTLIPFASPGPGYGPGESGLPSRAVCLDEIAREAGLRNYIAAKLNLTAPQRVLWQRLEKAAVAGADTRRKACANLPVTAPPALPPLPVTMTHEKALLAARLAELIEVQPALAAVYDSLSIEQRGVLDPPRPARP